MEEYFTRIEETFNKYAKKDGEPGISRGDLLDVVCKEFSVKDGKEISDILFDGMDVDDNNVIDVIEFTAFVTSFFILTGGKSPPGCPIGQALESLKNLFDENAARDGDSSTLTKQEVTNLIREKFQSSLDGEAEDAMLKCFDENDDNVYKFEEFVRIALMVFLLPGKAEAVCHS